MTNKWLAALVIAVAGATAIAPAAVEAKRLGGGGSAGMQRSLPARPAPDALPARPAQQAAPAPAAAPNAATAPRRSWMGPIAGLAAGLGIAALMGHLGLGEGFGNVLTLLLLAGAAVFLVRMLMRRFGGQPAARPATGPAYAFQGAGADRGHAGGAQVAWPAAGAAAALDAAPARPLPAGFDAEGFARTAKMIFIRMQAANDTADLTDLREFTTPELFASLRLDLQERKDQPQQTDVLKVDAQVLEVTQEPGRQVVSVRFSGLVREERDGTASDFDEVWHLVKPDDGSRNWAIAGIQQAQ